MEPRAGPALLARDVLVGRQPIFDRKLAVCGYELLFRRPPGQEQTAFDGTTATAEVVVNAFTEFGIESVVGDQPAFINSTRDFLLSDVPFLLPRTRVVLEVLEDMIIDRELVHRVAELVDEGFTIALDDYVAHPRWDPLLPLAHIVKVDVPELSDEQLGRHVEQLRTYGLAVLAEKVETEAEFEMLRDMGYDLFQGFFLARPKVLDRQRIPASRLSMLRLAGKLQDESTSFDDLEVLIRGDVSLSFKLIRFMNSSALGLPAPVSTVRQALVYLGIGEVRRLAALLAMSGFDARPQELFRVALVRARMCERLALAQGSTDAGSFFTLGLFSTLSSLLQSPLDAVLRDLSLTEQMEAALLDGAGPMGETLRLALACERGEWVDVPSCDLPYGDVMALYLGALAWGDEQYRLL